MPMVKEKMGARKEDSSGASLLIPTGTCFSSEPGRNLLCVRVENAQNLETLTPHALRFSPLHLSMVTHTPNCMADLLLFLRF